MLDHARLDATRSPITITLISWHVDTKPGQSGCLAVRMTSHQQVCWVSNMVTVVVGDAVPSLYQYTSSSLLPMLCMCVWAFSLNKSYSPLFPQLLTMADAWPSMKNKPSVCMHLLVYRMVVWKRNLCVTPGVICTSSHHRYIYQRLLCQQQDRCHCCASLVVCKFKHSNGLDATVYWYSLWHVLYLGSLCCHFLLRILSRLQ